MPPPTGVVSGPLIPMRCSRKAATVSSGSQSPVSSKAFCPASTSFQATLWPCLAAAASRTSLAAGQMSTPVPSPSMKGMMGSSGTWSVPSSPMRMRSAMDGMLRGETGRSQFTHWGSLIAPFSESSVRGAGRTGGQQLAQAGVLSGLRAEDVTNPSERRGGVDFGPPQEHLLYVQPILGTVKDCLADNEVLGCEDRHVHRAEADHTGTFGHFEVQLHGGEEHVEVGAVPVQPRLPVDRDGRPVLGSDRHPEQNQGL